MSETNILKRGLQNVHEQMALWMLQNPSATLRDMSMAFGYTPSWLSQVINSDMFKAYMAERMKDVEFGVAIDIPSRMAALAHLAIDRMEEKLSKTEDVEVVVDAFDKVMHRYGYAPNARNAANQQPGAFNQQNNIFFLSQDKFKQVQEKLIKAHQPALPKEANGAEPDVSTAEEV